MQRQLRPIVARHPPTRFDPNLAPRFGVETVLTRTYIDLVQLYLKPQIE